MRRSVAALIGCWALSGLACEEVPTRGASPDTSAEALAANKPPAHPEVELHHDGPGRPACQIEVSGHQQGSWSTDWHPRVPGVPHPTHARSNYWASESEREVIRKRNIDFPLELTCAGPHQGGPGGAFSAISYQSTEKDVPRRANTYPLVAGPRDRVKPGEFGVGILLVGEHLYDPSRGTLRVSRFDERGVAGSFELRATLLSDSNEVVKVKGRFDIPCGDVAQSLCQGPDSGVARVKPKAN